MGLVKYGREELKMAFGGSLYSPEMCYDLMEHMREGFSFDTFCGKYLLNKATVQRWLKKHPEFMQAYEIGQNLQRYQWEHILLEQAQGVNRANPAAMIFALKNYFPDSFQDKREVAVTASQIVVDTGIGHRDNNHIEEAEVVKENLEQLDFTEFEEEEPKALFTQTMESMFEEEDELDCL